MKIAAGKELHDILPRDLEAYLASTSWLRDGEFRDIAAIWHKPASPSAEVVVPLKVTLKDYADRLRDAVDAIALEEQRAVNDVAKDVARAASNAVSIRVVHKDTKGGTIPLNDGVSLIKHAKDLLASAAMSLRSRKRHFAGAHSKDANSFLDSLLLGQTEVGSYIINVIAPVEPGAEVAIAPPFSTAVTENLAAGLHALVEADQQFSESADVTAFDSAVEFGVSANMCDALVGLSGHLRAREFEIRVTPASGYGAQVERSTFAFSPDAVERISVAAEYYKDNYVIHDQTIIGFIKRLDRPHGQSEGTVLISASVARVERNVSVQLNAEDYDQAIQAHRENLVVQCSGDVHVTSRTTKLLKPSGFRVLGSGELFGGVED